MASKILNLRTFGFLAFSSLIIFSVGCKKKDRLSVSTSALSITPPSTTLLKGEQVSLTARRVSSNGAVEFFPADWTTSGACVTASNADLNSTFGESVTFTAPNALCDAFITATYGGETATSQIAIVTFKPTATIYSVYSENGLPTNSTLEATGLTITTLTSGYTPEGNEYLHFVPTATGSFWYIDLHTTKNLSAFTSGKLKFSIRLTAAGGAWQVKVKDSVDRGPVTLSGANGFSNATLNEWQEVSINIVDFPALSASAVTLPFLLTESGSTTYDIDAVRWEP